MIVTFPLALQPAFALIRQEVRQSRGPVMALAPAAVPPCLDSLPLAPHIQSPVRACYGGGLLTRPFGSWCLIYSVSRWLDFLPRQTSVAKIRAGRLLKKFFRFCFANLLRNVVFLSCLHSICLLRGQRDGLPMTRGY